MVNSSGFELIATHLYKKTNENFQLHILSIDIFGKLR